jgi:hypothetical protein
VPGEFNLGSHKFIALVISVLNETKTNVDFLRNIAKW